MITLNVLETNCPVSIALDKIVSFVDDTEVTPFRLVIDLVNGMSYVIRHHEEQLGAEIINAMTRGSIEETILFDCPDVDSIFKTKTS